MIEKSEISREVNILLLEKFDIDVDQIARGARVKKEDNLSLRWDLGLDSITCLELMMDIEARWNIRIPDVGFNTLGEVKEAIYKSIQEAKS